MTTKQATDYLDIECKAIDEDKRIVEGIASTINVDLGNDIVIPNGVQYRLPIKLLWNHDPSDPIGNVFWLKVDKKQIVFRAQVAKPAEDDPPQMRFRLDEAWRKIKRGLWDKFSIGYKVLDRHFDEEGRRIIEAWKFVELSVVALSMNEDCGIRELKRMSLPAPGSTDLATSQSAGASAKHSKGKKMSKAQRLQALKQQLAEKLDRIDELNDLVMEEKRLKSDEERTEVDQLRDEVKHLRAEISDLEFTGGKTADKEDNSVADVTDVKSARDAANARAPYQQTTVKGDQRPEGVAFAQYIATMVHAKGIPMLAQQIAEKMLSYDPRIANLCQKAAVGAAVTTTPAWAGAASDPQTVMNDFIKFLRPATLKGRIDAALGAASFRKAEFNKKTVRQTGGGAAGWVGQAKPIALQKGALDTVTLPITKIASIMAIAQEQADFNNIDLMIQLRDDLIASCVGAQDATFVDPAAAAVSNVSPASITNGLTPIASAAGTDADSVRKDFTALRQPFTAAEIAASGLILITNEDLAGALADMYNAIGVPEFPDMEVTGGKVRSWRAVFASNHVPIANVIALSPQDILYAEDSDVEIKMSTEASVEMLDGALTQDGTAGTGASLVSAFQNDMILIRAIRKVGWIKGRDEAAAYINNADWNGLATV